MCLFDASIAPTAKNPNPLAVGITAAAKQILFCGFAVFICGICGMPKQIDWEEIRKYWQQNGASAQALVDRFGVGLRSVEARMPEWRSHEKPPKVIAIGDRKPKEPSTHPPIRPRIPKGDLDELEIIDNAIVMLSTALSGEVPAQSLGSIAGGIVKLFDRRDKVQPKTAIDVAQMALSLGLSPIELARAMREECQNKA